MRNVRADLLRVASTRSVRAGGSAAKLEYMKNIGFDEVFNYIDIAVTLERHLGVSVPFELRGQQRKPFAQLKNLLVQFNDANL